jgi:hypothetical protein
VVLVGVGVPAVGPAPENVALVYFYEIVVYFVIKKYFNSMYICMYEDTYLKKLNKLLYICWYICNLQSYVVIIM